MNYKKLTPLLALLTLALSACDITFSLPNSSGSVNSSIPIQSEGGYYRPSAYSITQEQYKNASGSFSLEATGTQKVLVIPVSFTDYPCGSGCAARRADLQTTFFGTSDETSWESVASYYEKSSYGKLTLEGIVTPYFEMNMSTAELGLSSRPSSDYLEYFDPTWIVADQAVAWYKNYSSSNLQDYDQDSDGYIDALWLVYNAPSSRNKTYPKAYEDIYWAYTYWNYDNFGNDNPSSPVSMTYAWASYDFMYDGYGSLGIDAHTYIHETGHVLGLDDYYTYTEGDWGAAGAIDMMDYNVVDHNAYSKFILGWVRPYVIDGSQDVTVITLDPFESSGDFILINNSWNSSAYDEYLAIEFYTPTGLNYKDSLPGGYPSNNLRAFTEPGIKIYHVDSRLGLYANEDNHFMGYTDRAQPSSETYPYIAASNSSEYSQTEEYKLLHLIEAGGINTFKDYDDYATNATLFQAGDTFTPSTFATFFPRTGGRFNDGTQIGYSIAITAMSSTETTLTITKI